MMSIVASSIVLSVCNLLLSIYINVNILLVANILGWTLFNIWLTRRIRRIEQSENGQEIS